mmetsp:Transcript_129877/g.250487  ORF Transcript_129877/g.250487 Transcript_129877/m.250487 type:complete len:281 (-) Transcript_129877:40-882(-)
MSSNQLLSSWEELAYARRFLVKDFLAFPLFLASYLAQAFILELQSPVCTEPTAAQIPFWVILTQALLVAVALMAMLEQLTPVPTKGEPLYEVQHYWGRWIFLTRHCIMLQGFHMILSFGGAVLASAWLQHLTENMTFWIGSLGSFVTILFFGVAYNTPEFKRRCEEAAARDPPEPFRRKAVTTHLPGLLLAVLDILLAKRHANLQQEFFLVGSLAMALIYLSLYVVMLASNYCATGHWPYPELLNNLTVLKWLAFIFGLLFFVALLCSVLWSLSWLPSAW